MHFNNENGEYTAPVTYIRDLRLEGGFCASTTFKNEDFEEDPEFNW